MVRKGLQHDSRMAGIWLGPDDVPCDTPPSHRGSRKLTPRDRELVEMKARLAIGFNKLRKHWGLTRAQILA